MPTKKKTVKTTTAAAKETVEKAAEKKTTATKKAEVAKKAPAKKTAPKKETVHKKAAAKKPVEKKEEVKKAEPVEKKPEENLKTVKDYVDIINWKKGEAHAMDWLYIEVNAGDLLTEVEAGKDNLATVCKAILDCMLEGDGYIVEPSEADKVNSSLTVRYYCDNLSADRKKYFE